MEMRQPPLGRMSPGPRDRRGYDSRDSRSPSPQYRSPRHHRARDYSPATRSERRPSPPPGRHRASSPARSERYYRDRRERFRYSSSRDPSPYSTRSERSDRERDRAGEAQQSVSAVRANILLLRAQDIHPRGPSEQRIQQGLAGPSCDLLIFYCQTAGSRSCDVLSLSNM